LASTAAYWPWGPTLAKTCTPWPSACWANKWRTAGWNCEQENGSTRGSFHTTICVLEGLLAYERASGGSDALRAARQRGEEYLLTRHLLHRLSDHKLIDPAFMQFPY